MKFIADLHIHSKYSRATSKDMDIEHLAFWAKIKGIDLVGTGDFTHPIWFSELRKNLKPFDNGLYTFNNINFIPTSEISSIYKKNGKVRKIHNLVLAPSLEIVEKINKKLGSIGNIVSDGRPILGLDAKDLLEIVLEVSEDCMLIPCHAWTPWFSIFGANSGFDSIEECFEELSKHIYAIETGLSSDPPMNWRLSQLDNIALISCSDAHSPSKLGREVCVFDTDLSYKGLTEAIKTKDKSKFLSTIEFFPEEGKYHYDGHRNCNILWEPSETKKHKNICSVCNKPVTVGVSHRVDDLADRPVGFIPKNAIPYKSLIPLAEIIADVIKKGPSTKTVKTEYDKLIKSFGTEFKVLLDVSKEELSGIVSEKIAEGVVRVRKGKVDIIPGYDGVFGKINIFKEGTQSAQKKLF